MPSALVPMWFLVLCWFSALSAPVSAAQWRRSSEIGHTETLLAARGQDRFNLSFAFKHDSAHMQRLQQRLMEVSSPSSPLYGQHLSVEEIQTLMTPPGSVVTELFAWLAAHVEGADESAAAAAAFSTSPFNDYGYVSLSRAQLCHLFASELTVYTHGHSKQQYLGLANLQHFPEALPEHLRDTLAYISGPNMLPLHQDSSVVMHKAHDDHPVSIHVGVDVAPAERAFFLDDSATDYTTSTSSSSDGDSDPYAKLLKISDGVLGFFIPLKCPDGSTAVWLDESYVWVCENGYSLSGIIIEKTSRSGEHTYTTPVSLSYLSSYTADCAVGVFQTSRNYVLYSFEFIQEWQFGGFTKQTVIDFNGYAVASPTYNPSFFRSYYNIPEHFESTNETNLQAVVSLYLSKTEPGYYSETDLADYYKHIGLKESRIEDVSFHCKDCENDASTVDIETQLDIEWMSALGLGTKTYVWHNPQGAVSTLEGAIQDLQDAAGTSDFPYVTSFSYGARERDYVNAGFADHINEQLQALGALGLTFLVASGDEGAFGVFAEDCSQGFQPSFPASSPWVLSIGATQLVADSPGDCPYESAVSANYGAFITTGGGFSAEFPRPWYQDILIPHFLDSDACLEARPNEYYYNRSARGYPDIAGFGHNVEILADGTIMAVDGTSASSPALAGVFSLYNSARLDAGMDPLGFVNPLIYEAILNDSRTFNDVLQGTNNCGNSGMECCSDGFGTCTGWDAVTGLGTPHFGRLGKFLFPPHGLPGAVKVMTVEGCGTEGGLEWWFYALIGLAAFLLVILIGLLCNRYVCSKTGDDEAQFEQFGSNVLLQAGTYAQLSDEDFVPPERKVKAGRSSKSQPADTTGFLVDLDGERDKYVAPTEDDVLPQNADVPLQDM